MDNCKNCGAPSSGHKCAYCGTIHNENYTNHLMKIEQIKCQMEMEKVKMEIMYGMTILTPSFSGLLKHG